MEFRLCRHGAERQALPAIHNQFCLKRSPWGTTTRTSWMAPSDGPFPELFKTDRVKRNAERRLPLPQPSNPAVPSLGSSLAVTLAMEVTIAEREWKEYETQRRLSAFRAARSRQLSPAMWRNDTRLIRSKDMIPEIHRFQNSLRREGKLNPSCGCGEYGFVTAHCGHIFSIVPSPCPKARATGIFCQRNPNLPKPDKVYELENLFVVKQFGDDSQCDCDVMNEDDFMYIGVDVDAEAHETRDEYRANVVDKYQHMLSTPRPLDTAGEAPRRSYLSLRLCPRYQRYGGRVNLTKTRENIRRQSSPSSSSHPRRQQGIADKIHNDRKTEVLYRRPHISGGRGRKRRNRITSNPIRRWSRPEPLSATGPCVLGGPGVRRRHQEPPTAAMAMSSATENGPGWPDVEEAVDRLHQQYVVNDFDRK